MTEGAISLIESMRLIALVHAARKIADLDVVPVRVWKIVAQCEEHGRIEAEETLSMKDPAPGSLKCHLCAPLPWKAWMKNATAAVVRG